MKRGEVLVQSSPGGKRSAEQVRLRYRVSMRVKAVLRVWHVQLILGISPNETILCVSPGGRKKDVF